MPGGTPPPPPQSLWEVSFGNYRQQVISISVDFDEITHDLLGGRLHRDPECLYTHIALGLDDQGRPPRTFEVPVGDTVLTTTLMRRLGYRTYEDLNSGHIKGD